MRGRNEDVHQPYKRLVGRSKKSTEGSGEDEGKLEGRGEEVAERGNREGS